MSNDFQSSDEKLVVNSSNNFENRDNSSQLNENVQTPLEKEIEQNGACSATGEIEQISEMNEKEEPDVMSSEMNEIRQIPEENTIQPVVEATEDRTIQNDSNSIDEVSKENNTSADSNEKKETNEDKKEIHSKQSLLDRLLTIIDGNVLESKEEVERIKTEFYSLYNEEQQELRKIAEEAAQRIGETLTDWQPLTDEIEIKFKEALNAFKSKRNDALKRIEEELNNNLLRKENILAQLKEMSDAQTADVMDNVKKVKELQAEWKLIGHVPPQKNQEINKLYTTYLEKFYDLVKINFELRDLDFKKNLELKTILCEAAEKLKENPSVVEASRALQLLHEEWAEIGPVAKEFRESIWTRFKEASTVINKKHQAFFEAIHAKEEENLKKKQEIIEKIKQINIESLNSSQTWTEATRLLTSLIDEWRTIGYAPKKVNSAIYEEFRTLCNKFFKARSDYYKDAQTIFSQNLSKKMAIVEKVEEINNKIKEYKNSEEWKQATDQIHNLQKEWRQIGAVSRKFSNDVWKKFSSACDEFFTQRKELLKDVKNENKWNKDSQILGNNKRISLLKKMQNNLQKQLIIAENNILFFTGKSTISNKLVEDMQRRIEDLKKQILDIENKLKNPSSSNISPSVNNTQIQEKKADELNTAESIQDQPIEQNQQEETFTEAKTETIQEQQVEQNAEENLPYLEEKEKADVNTVEPIQDQPIEQNQQEETFTEAKTETIQEQQVEQNAEENLPHLEKKEMETKQDPNTDAIQNPSNAE